MIAENSTAELEGKAALVLGAGRNMGRAIALMLADRGADVVVHARANAEEVQQVAAEVHARGRRVVPLLADLGVRDQLEPAIRGAIDVLGGIDILVNTAMIRPPQGFLDITHDEWRRVMAVNLDGRFVACQLVLPGMMERGWGRVINFSGSGGFAISPGAPHRAHAVVTQTGTVGLTRALAVEFAPHGITVNTVAPGVVDTERTSEWYLAPGRSFDARAASGAEARKVPPPVGRMGTIAEAAALCGYLVSDQAAFVTGQTLHLNGGTYLS